jgi:hypothetical protein
MRLVIARVLSIAVALGVLALLVVQATTSGCASQRNDRPDPWLTTQVTSTPVPTAPAASAAEATPAVPPNPVIYVGPGYLPATKAAPVFFPPQQQAAPAPQQAAPRSKP